MLKLRKILLYNYIYYIILLLTILLAFLNINNNKKSIFKDNDNEFVGIIRNYHFDGDKLSIYLDGKEDLLGNYYIKDKSMLDGLKNSFKYGIKVKIIGELNSVYNNTIPNSFNYKEYLRKKGIYYTIKISDIEIISRNENLLYKIKNTINDRTKNIERYDYVKTFIIGDMKSISNDTVEEYRRIGISHLFAISGMHITLFSSILLIILKKLKIREFKRYILVDLFLIFYLFLTNFSPSVYRATIFFILISFNSVFYTNIKTINLMFLTISICLLINNSLLYDLGFIYSVSTSIGLIISSNIINKYNNYFIKLFIISLIAFLFSLPITISNFYEFNILSVLFNIVFVPYVTFIVYPLSLIVFFLPFLSFIFSVVIKIMELLSNYINKCSIMISISKCSMIIFIFYYVILLLIIYKKNLLYKFILIFLLLIMKYKYIFNDYYQVYFLDVGQGDSSVLISPYNNEVIMIDTGGILSYEVDDWQKKDKVYKVSNNTISFLKSKGIDKIDLLIITHGDEDHIGEIFNISKRIKIDRVMLNNNEYNIIENKVMESFNVVNTYVSKYFNYRVLNYKLYNDENDDSLITLFNINNYRILYMGDASKKSERDIILKYNLEIDFIKIGHHGSKTSSDEMFLNSINVKEGLISSGRNNRFNHPHYDTINTLNKLNIKYYNTQTCGTLEMIIKNKVKKKCYKP